MDSMKLIVKPFAKVTVECFDQMVDVKLSIKKIQYTKNRHRQNGVYAVIGFTGDMHGMIAISFTRDTAIKIISRFMGEETNTIDEEAIDAVGEIINIIAGGKSYIEGYKLNMSLPSVMYGQPLLVSLPRDVPVIAAEFFAEEIGDITLFICLRETA